MPTARKKAPYKNPNRKQPGPPPGTRPKHLDMSPGGAKPGVKAALRREAFKREYAKDMNATQAAIRVGYSPRTARVQASALLAKPDVKQAVAEIVEKRIKETDISAKRVLEELGRHAFGNMEDFTYKDAEGNLRFDFSNVDRATLTSMDELQIDEYTDGKSDDARLVKRTKFRLSARIKALELLARYHKLLTDKLELTGPNGEPLAAPVLNVAFIAAPLAEKT